MSGRYWGLNDPFCSVQRSSDSQCLSVGRTTPKIAPSRGGSRPHLTDGSLGPCKSAPNCTLIGSFFWQGSRTWPTDRHTGRWTHIQIHKPTTLLRQLCYQNQLISTSVCSNSPRHASCMQYSLKRGVDTRRSREAGWRGVSSCTTPRKNVVLLELYNLAIKPFCVIFTVRFNFKLSTAALIFRHIPPFL